MCAIKSDKIMSASCDSAIRDFLMQGLFPSPQIWSLSVGPVSPKSQAFTDVVDLGENHLHTLLIARMFKEGSVLSSIGIYSSIDGVQWAVAPGYRTNIARSNQTLNPFIYVYGLPMGRYARILYKNYSIFSVNEFVVELMAFPGI